MRLRSVILSVGDWAMVERCRDWYAGHVGLASSRELTGESSWLAAGDVEVGFHTGRAAETPAVTLSFVVADVDTEVERLRAEGVDIADPEDKPWGARAASTRDPAGNEVILMTPRRQLLGSVTEIRLVPPDDRDSVVGASALFAGPAKPEFTERFLASVDHFILVAYAGEQPVGFVSGAEITHPDKGTEMFLYELGVAESFRGRGTATALVTALRDLARQRGCYDMWVLTDADNTAGLATYRSAGASVPTTHVMLVWDFDEPDSG